MFTGNAHAPPLSRIKFSTASASRSELPPALICDIPNSRASLAMVPARTYFSMVASSAEGILNLLLRNHALPDHFDQAFRYVNDSGGLRVLRLSAVYTYGHMPL